VGLDLGYMRAKKILFIEAINLSPHIETSMELADLELKKGNKVYYYFIGHALELQPYWGITLNRKWWNHYFLPENRAARMIRLTYFKNIKNLSSNINYVDGIEIPEDIHKIKYLFYDGVQIGQAIFGDYINYQKKYSINNDNDRLIVRKLIINTVQTVSFTKKLLLTKKFDLVYIFNGRFTFNYPILKLCQLNNLQFRIHERGSTRSVYFLEEFTPHNIEKVSDKVLKTNINSENFTEVGHNFFWNKRKGVETSWVSFKKNTNRDKIKLPLNDRLVVFYTSSEFEFEAASDQNPRNKIFPTQIAAIKKVVKLMEEINFQLVVRVHPNMCNSFELLKELGEISGMPKVKIFWPDDEVDSYDLLDLSSVVITYGSTIGAEAMYWNKPCVLMQRAYYEKIEGLFIPENDLQLKRMIGGVLDGTIDFKRNEKELLKFGYYNSTFGVPFKIYEPSSNGFHNGLFMGKNLQKSWLHKKVLNFIN
jgi:hypothetical protein